MANVKLRVAVFVLCSLSNFLSAKSETIRHEFIEWNPKYFCITNVITTPVTERDVLTNAVSHTMESYIFEIAHCSWSNAIVNSRDIIMDLKYHKPRVDVEHLRISGSRFNNFPRRFFDVINVEHLVLSTENLADVQEGDWENADNLKSLRISQSAITNLPENCFRHLVNLESLTIQNTPLATIDSSAFNGMSKLKTLEIVKSKIETMGPEILMPLVSLETVVFYNITSLEPTLFQSNRHLKTIKLFDKNDGVFLNSNLFANLNDVDLSLEYYNYFSNDSRKINFTIPPNIKSLSLWGYNVSKIDFSQSNLQKLQIRLGRIPEDMAFLGGLTNLRELDLIETYNNNVNQTLSIPAGVFENMLHLLEVRIQGCSVTHVECDAFANVPKLNSLSITDSLNREEVYFDFCILGNETKSLRHLTLERNKCKYNIRDFRQIAYSLETYND